MFVRLVLCGCVFLSLGGPLFAELKPDEIAIIATRRSPASRALAEYYAKSRGIPAAQICLIDTVPGGTLTRAQWQNTVRPSLRRWIADQRLESRLRCLVTVWDVPLKIGKQTSNAANQAARINYLQAERTARFARLRHMVDEVHRLTSAGRAPQPSAVADTSAQTLAAELQKAFQAAQQRLTAIADTDQRKQVQIQLQRIFLAGGGVNTLVRNVGRHLAATANPQPAQTRELDVFKGRLLGLREGLVALQSLPDTVPRDQQILALVETSDGLLGTVTWIDEQLALLRKNETNSSFDSELSLLLWPDYPLLRWQVNSLNYRLSSAHAGRRQTTLMVARLEAPTLELTKRLIDTARQVEASGLQGTVYLDARGIKSKSNSNSKNRSQQDARGSYADYDQSVRNLATILQDHTDLKVVLDNKPGLFQPGDCPGAAVYCGWYSLANYVDAFDWKPGAVGYHLASSEAVTLRDPKSNVWCKRMLEDGVCATIGPVFEPYLAAFPRPDEFLVLLLSGRYTLVECYYRTKPFNSWAMVLIGDPLYNPFKRNRQFTKPGLPDNLRRLIEG